MKTLVPILFLALISMATQSAVQTKAIDYKDGCAALTGHLYWGDAIEGKVPGR